MEVSVHFKKKTVEQAGNCSVNLVTPATLRELESARARREKGDREHGVDRDFLYRAAHEFRICEFSQKRLSCVVFGLAANHFNILLSA